MQWSVRRRLIDHGDGSQAVAAEVEEIVLAGDGRALKALRPDLRDALFNTVARLVAARSGDSLCSEATRSSAARSTLPEVLTGIMGTRSTAVGSMYEGSVADK